MKNAPSSQPDAVQAAEKGATALRDYFIERAKEGAPEVCTYSWAYRHLIGRSYLKWSLAYAKQVVSLAQSTPSAELPGLGRVRLDAFVVSGDTGFPGDGHWETAGYDREGWGRILGSAKLLK